jgi:hypothetical protein
MTSLSQAHTRRQLAAGLTRAVAAAAGDPEAIGSAMPVQRAAVSSCRRELLALADRLRAPDPVDGAGLALVVELLEDSTSPLYQSTGNLRTTVAAALEALDGSRR